MKEPKVRDAIDLPAEIKKRIEKESKLKELKKTKGNKSE